MTVPSAKRKEKKKGTSMDLIILACVVWIALILAGIWAFLNLGDG